MRYPSESNPGQQPYPQQPAQPIPQPYAGVQPAPTLQEQYTEGEPYTGPVPRVQPGASPYGASWPNQGASGQYTGPMPQQPMGYPVNPTQPMPPVRQPGPYTAPVQPIPSQYTGPMPPMQQGYAPEPQPAYPPQPQPGSGDSAMPLTPALRQAASRYFHDTGLMLAMVMAVLIVIFIVVRLATRGYLWGLIFVLAAALVLEGHALQLFMQYLSDRVAGRATVRAVHLSGISTDTPSLLSRLGLSARARYILTDESGTAYRFVAERELLSTLGDLGGAELELAFLERSHLLAGLSPIRAGEFQTVLESARERQLRQIFKDYLPTV